MSCYSKMYNWTKRHNVPRKTVVKSLCCSEANNGINDSCSIDGGDAIDDRDDHCILFTVVTKGKNAVFLFTVQCNYLSFYTHKTK